MPEVEDHSELPDFLSAETLARICLDLAEHKHELQESQNASVAKHDSTDVRDEVVRTEALLAYYWESLRALETLDGAFRMINEIDADE